MSQRSNPATETTGPAGSTGFRRALTARYLFVLLVAATFLPVLGGLVIQGPEYDESIVMLTVSGHTHVAWPREPIEAGQIQGMFADRANFLTLLSDIRQTDVHPPLHYVVAWLAHSVFGPSLMLQRNLSLAALAGALLIMLRQWRRDFGADVSAAVIFTIIFMISPAAYYAGSTARGYALVMLFLATAYVALRRIAECQETMPADRTLGPAALVGLGTGLAVLTHYLAAIPAVVLGVTAMTLLAMRRDWRAIAALCVTGAVPALISASFLLKQLHTRGGFAQEPFPGFGSMLARMLGSLFVRMPGERLPVPDGLYCMAIVAAATALILFGTAAALRHRRGFMTLGLPTVIVALQVGGLIIQQWGSGALLTQPRYLALVWPFTAVILAQGAIWYRDRLRWGIAVPALLVASYMLEIGLALYSMPGEPFKIIVEAANARNDKSILIVDRGYGRGIPAPIVLTAPPEMRLWIVTPDMLKDDSALARLKGYDEIHAALSIAPTSEPISQWLDRLPKRLPYVERPTAIYLHRYFVRKSPAS